MNKSHGSPYDRGGADSYYGRPMKPHWWPAGTYKGWAVIAEDMTDVEIEEYYQGYEDNELSGDKKEW